ncbi:MAG: flavin reductase family protein [Pseudomonadota bacterium]
MELIEPAHNTRRFRNALGQFATGVTVITTHDENFGWVGITANSFASVSLEPPLVLWSPARASQRFDVFSEAIRYAIHVLRADQREIADGFVKDWDAFGTAKWAENDHGVPILTDCLARFECKLSASHEGGDHVVVVGEVTQCALGTGAPLIFAAGRYGGFTDD